MTKFDWHSDVISRATVVDQTYKSTQNVRRFMASHCGKEFKLDRDFIA